MRNYWDQFGRLHTKEVTQLKPIPTHNSYIYTAYYLRLGGKLPSPIDVPRSVPFGRHPLLTIDAPPVSHDEITGVCILTKGIAIDTCNYLDLNYNQFSDLAGFVPTPFYKLNWFKIIKTYFSKIKNDVEPRHALLNYPEVFPVAFWQQPQYRWFYRRAAGLKPSLWEKLVFVGARLVSIYKWDKNDPNLLMFFSLMHLDHIDNLGIEGKFVSYFLNKLVENKYGDVDNMMRFKTKDIPLKYQEDHPWFNL
jgi:hypothetical protein